jgi:hypothetical protein
MTRPVSNDLRERVVARCELPGGGGAVSRCGVVGGEVVAALSCDRLSEAGQDGRASQAGAGTARAFIRERISHTPHLTLHGLKDKLVARGVKVSHNAVWMFLRHEGLRFHHVTNIGMAAGPPRSILCLRRERQTYCTTTSPRALDRGLWIPDLRAGDDSPLRNSFPRLFTEIT